MAALYYYIGGVAYEKLLALQVGLVSSRCPAQALLIRYSPCAHPAHPLLRPCSLRSANIRCCVSILVPVSRSCDVDFVKFRRWLPWPPWLQNWSLTSWGHTMPPSMFWLYNTLPPAFLFLFPAFLPVYRGLIVLPIVLQHDLLAHSKLFILRCLHILSLLSLFPSPLLRSTRSSLLSWTLSPFAMPKKKPPQEHLQRAREKGSENNKDIVNSTEIKKTLQPKTEDSYARSLNL